MAYISDDQINRIKQSVDIVDIISQYVELKQSGRNFKGLCPFHTEKTPSFMVSPEGQNYHCFGCGESGDVISFLMNYNNLSFLESINILADRAGIVLEEVEVDEEKVSKKKRLLKINHDAMMYYYKNFLVDRKAQSYLRNRDIDGSVVNPFMLGYAKPGNNILRYMENLGHSEEDLLELGLLSKGNNGSYDKYRDRIMFPIFDNKDKVIGFGGRIIGNGNPKYLNSPESEIFHKGDNIYGIHTLKNRENRDLIILVEGYMDVIGLYKEGIKNACASLGTALTPNQARIIKRLGKDIYISYDSDLAGIKATQRAIDIFKDFDVTPSIIFLDKGMVLDEYIKKYGKEAYLNKINEALHPLDFNIKVIRDKYDFNEESEKLLYLDEISKFLATIERSVIRDEYVKKISREDNIELDSLFSDVNRLVSSNYKPEPSYNIGEKIESDSFKEETLTNNLLKRESYNLQLEFLKISFFSKEAFDYLQEDLDFISDFNILEILNEVLIIWNKGDKPQVKDLIDKFSDNKSVKILDFLSLQELQNFSNQDLKLMAKELQKRIYENKLKFKREELRMKLDNIEDLESDESLDIMRDIMKINTYINSNGGNANE